MARVKHVLTTKMVKHVWAQQNQDYGRNSGESVSFQGTALYSYATPIANFVKNKKGKPAVLITTTTYSVTTSGKHMPHTWDIPPGIPVFYARHIGITGGRSPQPENNYHKENLARMAEVYNAGLASFARSRNYKPGSYEVGASKDIQVAKEYCAFFGLRFTPAKFPLATREHLDKLLAQSKKESIRKSKETRERKASRQVECERQLVNHMELHAALSYGWRHDASEDQKQRLLAFQFNKAKANGWRDLPGNWELLASHEDKHAIAEKQLQEHLENSLELSWRWEEIASEEQKTRYRKEREARAQASIKLFLDGRGELVRYFQDYASEEQIKAIEAMDLINWRNGVTSHPVLSHEETLLRVKGENVETSRGAEFPVNHAKRAWPVIKTCRERGEVWQRNGHTVRLGHFQIDRIDAGGTVHAGCHSVTFAEVELIAKQLKLV